MKILTIIGARPQMIKAAAVSNKLRKKHVECLVHTGQHYDANMSDVFFRELNIPLPDYNLGIGSGTHGEQTGRMLIELEKLYFQESPDLVLVYGDTNSTLAGALAASKLSIPIAHVEAGLRSFNERMPEEQNRILTDHLSSLLFTPTQTAEQNLKTEGIRAPSYFVGDVMYDAVLSFQDRPLLDLSFAKDLPGSFLLATIHRAENTDVPERLKNIFSALNQCGYPIVLPLHPRTKKCLESLSFSLSSNIHIIPPVGYLEMLYLERLSDKILTDSGGVQKEAYFLKKPCITLREESEWTETVEAGWNCLVGSDCEKILHAIDQFTPQGTPPEIFGNGDAADKIVSIL